MAELSHEKLENIPHPTQATARRHPADVRLRRAGWSILSRPRGREPIWRREGLECVESQALRILSMEEKTQRREDCGG